MPISKRVNTTKKNISNNISKNLGIPKAYSEKILNDTIDILIQISKFNSIVKIKNFGTFYKLHKLKRMGRNPKNRKAHEISERKTISFKASTYLKNKINK
jgi:nucleoid DNA-binding protein